MIRAETLQLSLTDRMELAIYHTECNDTVNLFWEAISEIERLRKIVEEVAPHRLKEVYND